MKPVGIEKINLYGSSLCLKQSDLALARGKDPTRVVDDYMIDTRSLNPPWEDTITMAVNAAAPMLTDEDKSQIGMLIVGTEGSVDFGKPISTNIHGILGLPHTVRNFETKHACYSGAAALDVAVNWIASGLNRGKKAMVIATDFSRRHFGKDWEFVLGGAAAAMVVSDTPKIMEFETGLKGSWTTDIYDTYRPTARHESGNNEVSLYSYSDALEGAYRDFLDCVKGPVDFDTMFDYNIYHMPFPAMAFQAHRILCNIARPRAKSEVRESFNAKVLPSLHYARRVGSMYGASNFFGLCGLIQSVPDLKPGARVGMFAYGSGAIGEFYSGRICDSAKEIIDRMQFDQALDRRKKVSVAEYEMVETRREELIEKENYTSDLTLLDNWYGEFYSGRRMLVLSEVKEYRRIYQWS
jgi:3-hydroxy-3-methylglutaryl CoA synthase